MLVKLRHLKDSEGKDRSEFVDQQIHITLKRKMKDPLTEETVTVETPYIFAGDTKYIKNIPPETQVVTQLEIPDTELVTCRDFVLKCRLGVEKVKVRDEATGKEKFVEVTDHGQFGKWLECIDIPEKVKKAVGL